MGHSAAHRRDADLEDLPRHGAVSGTDGPNEPRGGARVWGNHDVVWRASRLDRKRGVDDLVPVAILQELEALLPLRPHLHEEPEHRPGALRPRRRRLVPLPGQSPLEQVPGPAAHGTDDRPLRFLLLLLGECLRPQLLPGDLLLVVTPLEADAEDVPCLAPERPSQAPGQSDVLGPNAQTSISAGSLGADHLAPVLVAHDLELPAVPQELRLQAPRLAVPGHLLQGPAAPAGGDVVLAGGHARGLHAADLLPGDGAELASDLEVYPILVSHSTLVSSTHCDNLEVRSSALGRGRGQVASGAGDAPVQAPDPRVGAFHGGTLVGHGHLWVETLALVSVKDDLEVLPPVLSERHSVAEAAVALVLHRLGKPTRPRPGDVVGPAGLLVLL
mmetsp:Transcript_69035/g.202083  ORF Transcript_69035/g.202083 Transcript_69035/m.202083 type:complete len:387 (+) Transcript_69035:225-1385(+)